MSTTVPTGPPCGEKLVTDSVGVNNWGLFAAPVGVVTETFPAIAPSGTVARTSVVETIVNEAARLPNFTPVASPKFVPMIVT